MITEGNVSKINRLNLQLLAVALRAAERLEWVAGHRCWRWFRNGIEAILATTRLVDPLHPTQPPVQLTLDLVGRYEAWLGVGFAIVSLLIYIGRHHVLSGLLAKARN